MTSYRIAFLCPMLLIAVTARADELSREEIDFFERKIRPVLVRECYGCHSNQAGNVRGGLRMDTKELMRIGGSSGPAIVPGNLEDSWLYNAITHTDYVMPPKRKLPQNVIDDFKQWIEMGAPDPRTNNIGEIRSSISQDDIDQARETFWAYQRPVMPQLPNVSDTAWPKTPVDRFVLSQLESSNMKPSRDAQAWQVRRRLGFDLVGIPPTPRELESFTAAWQQDPDRAIANTIDQLLDQPQFGERWGRHWLDVARYAESTGREVNMTYPHAWRYRDYVIDSFNADKPFDRFIQEQIAGDLLPVDSDEQWAEHLIATTFLAIGPKNVNEQNRVQFAADLIDEQIDVTTRVFLGMSVACARCHDHKFDAIPQTDYYALAGIFGNLTTYFGNPPSEFGSFSPVQSRQDSSLLLLPIDDPNSYDKSYTQQELASMKSEMAEKLEEAAELRRNRRQAADGNAQNAQRMRIRLANELAVLSAKLAVVDEDGNPRSYCMGVQERLPPRNMRLLVRGEIGQPAQTVERGFPQVLTDRQPSFDSQTSGRLQLARWIGSQDNPLTARVMVNRIWQHLIGRGIVSSTENFGVTGQPPSHPELLDYLAVRFMESGWSVKSVIREIATSRVYRMRSTFQREYHEQDPDNALVWRANPRRLDAEVIRDAMLSISGQIELDRPRGSEVAKAGYTRVQAGILGNPREIAQEAIAMARQELSQPDPRQSGRGRPGTRNQFGGSRNRFPFRNPPNNGNFGNRPGRRPNGFFGGAQREAMEAKIREVTRKITHQLDMEEARFRSVYLPIVRDELPRALEVFDAADSSAIIGQRESSNTADQALYMMNNPFVIQQSEAFAKRIAAASSQPNQQIELAFLLAYGREPTLGERSASAAFFREFAPTTGYRTRNEEVLTALCQSLFASAEFRFVD